MKKTPRARIKVFLVDDHPSVRDGVRTCLTKQGAFKVVGEASDDAEALRKVRRAAPDVIILDISLPSLDGGELAKRLRQAAPAARILAFSMHAGQEYVVRMARCGAHGYVTKDQPVAVLVEAIQQLHKGGLSFPAGMADALLAPGSAPSAGPALTTREREVLSLLAEGLANKEVARRLGISVRTAETHREHLSRKLGLNSISGLTKYAIQHGLTALGPAEPKKTP